MITVKPVANYGAGLARRAPADLFAKDAETGDIVFQVDPDPMVARAQIMALKDRLLALPDECVEFPVEHIILDGTYTRKLFIAKGQILIGKIHRKAYVNIVAKGDISVATETGWARVRAGFTLATPAGICKVGYAHEDTIFINVFRTDETDIDKIEAEIACESYEALNCAIDQKMEDVCQ